MTDSLKVKTILSPTATSVAPSLGDDELSVGAVVSGEVVSIVTDDADAAAEGPVFDAESVTPPEASLATTVPSEVQITVTVIDVKKLHLV